jgi:hypothetical protein
MTKKRRPNLLPRVPSRHITVLRHTLSFGSNSGYEAPVNSYLTGASPILLGLRSRNGRRELSRSSFFAQRRNSLVGSSIAGPLRSSLLTPQRRPPTLAQRAFTLAQRALCLIARSARCDVRWSPPSSSDLVKPRCVAEALLQRVGFHQLLLQIGGTNIAS